VNHHYTRATGQRSKSLIGSPPSRQATLAYSFGAFAEALMPVQLAKEQ